MSAPSRLPMLGTIDQEASKAIRGLSAYVRAGSLEEGLRALIDMRASQINGCAWCLDMHAAEARAAGVDQRRLDLIAVWRETGELFSERQRAALALTEAVTLISEDGVSDELWSEVTAAFDEKETVQLLVAIAAINVHNRINVAIRTTLRPEQVAPGRG